ncbi:hypothetical protein SAMN05421664_0401 [Chryseobacterium soldanellicola]|uniref:Uncharacterized protein n=1 Tax=Chryseobacterium soldanellicola TaxID=311333 RepID=A0A1H0Y070_9FLAO|nr:hypothetical protein [Chryseobacterium soldanellicola]SDQ08567.1 hypothetical protein SAMN05421664_0401 [Chryseobacterium soldanellicola]
MKKYFKEYTEHLSAIILLFYILGFSYQYCYYQYFDIKIQYYVALTDIIFQSIGNVLKSAVIFCLINVTLDIIYDLFSAKFLTRAKNKNKYDRMTEQKKKRVDRYFKYSVEKVRPFYTFILLFITMVAGIYIFDDKFYFLLILLPNLIYGTYKIIPKENRESDKTFSSVLGVMLFIILLGSYCYWGYSEASDVSNSYSSKVIKTDKIYTGDNKHKFIGETSQYIFVLNKNNDVVTVINKGNLNEMNVEPNRYEIEDIRQKKKQIDAFADKYIHKEVPKEPIKKK